MNCDVLVSLIQQQRQKICQKEIEDYDVNNQKIIFKLSIHSHYRGFTC